MDLESIFLARVLFWTLCVALLFVPLRWAFVCLIVAAHLDITTASFTSSNAIGLENTVRIVVLPAILAIRMRLWRVKDVDWGIPQKIWLALIVYASAAAIWSDYRLSALKMVAYLSMYLVLYAMFSEAWAAGLLGVKSIRTAALFTIALAFVQTFLMGNMVGVEDRLTSFSTPQYFAAYLLATLAILIFSEERGLFHYASCALIIVAIVMSGSRYIFVSTILLLVISSLRSMVKGGRGIDFRRIRRRTVGMLAAVAAAVALLISYAPSSRVDDFLDAFIAPNMSIQDVGTWAWRLKIYTEILDQLSQRSARQLFFGSGTSSGAALMLDLEPSLYLQTGEDAVDGNRVLHNEFLRSIYEWGLPGIALLCGFLVSICVAFTRKIKSDGGGPALAFVGVLPSIVFGLAIENLLAGAVSAAGIGIVLALSYSWRLGPSTAPEPAEAEVYEMSGGDAAVGV